MYKKIISSPFLQFKQEDFKQEVESQKKLSEFIWWGTGSSKEAKEAETLRRR